MSRRRRAAAWGLALGLLLPRCPGPSPGTRDAGEGDGGIDGGPGDPCQGGALPGGRYTRLFAPDGGAPRTFHFYVPPSDQPSAARPLVFNFHALGSNAAAQQFLSGLNRAADRHGFVAVHPEGEGQSWNAGNCCGDAQANQIDDVGFTRAMVEALALELCVDRLRLYAMGFSNGGFLAYRLACEAADTFAAIAPVAGAMGVPDCQPARPVSIAHFHGTADAWVPYEGGGPLGLESARAAVARWGMRNGCAGALASAASHGEVTREDVAGCPAGVAVRLYTIDGGGHTWPDGGVPQVPFGHTTRDLDATEEAWRFFADHPRL